MARKKQPRTELGGALRAARTRLRYSQNALGDELSVSGTVISRWELGRVRPPIESIARFADLAGTTEEERDALYSQWLLLAGYRQVRTPPAGPLAPPAAPEGHAVTVEGAMAGAIIDQVSDPACRLALVLRLRDWVLQSPEVGAESGPAPDTRSAPPASPERHDAPGGPGTPPPTG